MLSPLPKQPCLLLTQFPPSPLSLPLQTRDMPLKQFQEKYPDDFKTGALQEIRQRYAAMAEAAQQSIPSTAGKGSRVGTKRAAAEPITVLKTVKTRRTASALMPSWGTGAPAAAPAAAPAPRRNVRPMEPSIAEENEEEHPAPGPSSLQEAHLPAGKIPTKHAFNGVPLQTPLPFAGSAMPLPVTMLTQKRGGRTKAAAAPDAAVVTTADGMQWALGKDGMAAIPESHRAEVAEMLSAQFNFLAAALGKTVFDRPGGRGASKR